MSGQFLIYNQQLLLNINEPIVQGILSLTVVNEEKQENQVFEIDLLELKEFIPLNLCLKYEDKLLYFSLTLENLSQNIVEFL